jgi:D-alanyl-D-alanine carboxypeptidase (penicillin-binding protein 5/6)
MALLLTVEALEAGEISLDDTVTASKNAADMGEAQIFLSEGERMPLRDILKSVVIASANDATVALAEHLAGTETVFVARMNARARQLGMTNTNFTNCTGLPKDGAHVTTARDIAVKSRELIGHGIIKEYTTIWMDTVRGGTFGLSNTNRLIRFYDGATGLKTGYTDRSMYCLSATAERDGVEYIAVVLGDATSDGRFESAKTLLSYAFANYTIIPVTPDEALPPLKVDLGLVKIVQPVTEREENLLLSRGDAKNLTKTVELAERLLAPVAAGEEVGRLIIRSGETVLGEYRIVAGDDVARRGWGNVFGGFVKLLFTAAEE